MPRTTPKRTGPKPLTVPKSAPKFCGGGHRQNAKWRPGDDCWQCTRDIQRRLEEANTAAANAEFRRIEAAKLPPLPDDFRVVSRDGKSSVRYSIPPHLRRRRR